LVTPHPARPQETALTLTCPPGLRRTARPGAIDAPDELVCDPPRGPCWHGSCSCDLQRPT
jgi:hypothetical protein